MTSSRSATGRQAAEHLSGKVVVVTGGGRGIGRAVAARAAMEGAAVVVADSGAQVAGGGSGDPDVADESVAAIRASGGRALAFTGDVATAEGAQGAISAAIDEFGQVDGLVCCAGNFVQNDLVSMTEAEWDETIRIHLRGQFLCARVASRAMIKSKAQGSIVLFSSMAAVIGLADQPSYSAAKAGVFGLLLSASRSLAANGIRVNAVLPGASTRMTDALWDALDEHDVSLRSSTAEGTWRDPANVAPCVIALIADQTASLTGQAFAVVGYQVTQVELARWGATIRSDREWAVEDLAHRLTGELPAIKGLDLESWPPA